jgi:iron-sulfur cluster assembly protein
MIQLTERAVEQVRALLAREHVPETGGLRLAVQGGGCSGLSYAIRLDTQARPNDKVFTFGDVKVFVDPKSFIYLAGTVLDYKVDMMHQGFEFKNPNAGKSCGCGESFSA